MPYRPASRRPGRWVSRSCSPFWMPPAPPSRRDGGAATIKAVSADAEVSVGTVYTYFATAEELLAAVLREAASIELDAVRASVATAPRTAAAQLCALVEEFARRAIRRWSLAWALLAESGDPLIDSERLSYRRPCADTVAVIISRRVASGSSQDKTHASSGRAASASSVRRSSGRYRRSTTRPP
jgi:AcrR family transcriptional regulator